MPRCRKRGAALGVPKWRNETSRSGHDGMARASADARGSAAGLAPASGLGAARARRGARAPADGFREFEAAPGALQLAARRRATRLLAYNGARARPAAAPSPGRELKVRLANKLSEPTTLSFPGLRAANAVAGIGGLTQPPIAPGASARHPLLAARRRLQSLSSRTPAPLPRAQIAQRPVRADRRRGASAARGRSRDDRRLSDWRLDDERPIVDDFADAGARARRGPASAPLVTANAAPAPLQAHRRAGRAGPSAARERGDRAGDDRSAIEGAKPLIVAVDGQPSEPFEPLHNLVPMAPGRAASN